MKLSIETEKAENLQIGQTLSLNTEDKKILNVEIVTIHMVNEDYSEIELSKK